MGERLANMSWDIGMEYDKSLWEAVSRSYRKMGYEILGNDGEYLYWRKWKGGILKRKTPPPTMQDIKRMLVDDYQKGNSP